MKLLWELNELVCVKHLKQCLEQNNPLLSKRKLMEISEWFDQNYGLGRSSRMVYRGTHKKWETYGKSLWKALKV